MWFWYCLQYRNVHPIWILVLLSDLNQNIGFGRTLIIIMIGPQNLPKLDFQRQPFMTGII